MASSLMAEGRFHHHGFVSLTKIKLRKSTFPAGTLVTYQDYAGSTSPVAVTAGKGLVGVRCCSCTVFPPLTFFLYGRPPGGFEYTVKALRPSLENVLLISD